MVRPIEIVDLFAKTPLAERVNQIEKAAPDLAQRQFALQLEELKAEKQQKSMPTPKTDEAIIHRDKEKEEKEQRRKKKKETEKKQSNQMSIDLKA